jgi:GxxExxY protein
VGQVIVECNATKNLNPVYDVQLLAYPRLTGLKLGLPMNFGEARVSDDARRVVNSF